MRADTRRQPRHGATRFAGRCRSKGKRVSDRPKTPAPFTDDRAWEPGRKPMGVLDAVVEVCAKIPRLPCRRTGIDGSHKVVHEGKQPQKMGIARVVGLLPVAFAHSVCIQIVEDEAVHLGRKPGNAVFVELQELVMPVDECIQVCLLYTSPSPRD